MPLHTSCTTLHHTSIYALCLHLSNSGASHREVLCAADGYMRARISRCTAWLSEHKVGAHPPQAGFSSFFSKRVNLKSWSLVFFILFLLFVNRSGLVPYYTTHSLIIVPTTHTKSKYRKPTYIPNTAILRVAGRLHNNLITSLLLAQHDFRTITILYERISRFSTHETITSRSRINHHNGRYPA